jgi:hypothetical protein
VQPLNTSLNTLLAADMADLEKLYEEAAKYVALPAHTLQLGNRQPGKSAMLAAGYGMGKAKFAGAHTGRWPRARPAPTPNEMALRVVCPVCRTPKEQRCIDLTRWPKRNAGNRRIPRLPEPHEPRLARGALLCEDA